MPPVLPPRTPEQREADLAAAAAARLARAEFKRNLKAGRLTVGDALQMADRDRTLARLKVVDLLRSLPGYGDVRAAGLMGRLQIAESRRLGGLGAAQRAALLAEFAPAAA